MPKGDGRDRGDVTLRSVPSDRGRERTRESYDLVAAAYSERFHDELDRKPLDRALLAALIERSRPGLPIADLGCGPGHVAAWIAGHGVLAVGMDLSPGMIEVGRSEHPSVQFREGDLLHLPASDGEFGAAIAFYSIIHLERTELPTAFGEIRRTLVPDGPLLVVFHVGSEVRHLTDWHGQKVDVDFRFFEPEVVVAALEAAGFAVEMEMTRSHYPDEGETRRGYVLARNLP